MKLPNQSLPLLSFFLFLLPLVSSSPLNRSSRAFTRKRQSVKDLKNYAGVFQNPPPDGTTFSYITGVVNIPHTQYVPSHGPAPTKEYACAWVGFGPHHSGIGDSGIMQTGCGWTNDGEGDQYARCWYEFFPAAQVPFPAESGGFNPVPGGAIGLELWRNSPTQARARLTDLGSGAAVSATFSAPEGHQSIGQQAEWIVEDQGINGGRAPLVDFGTFTMSGTYVTTSGGNTYPPYTDGYYVVVDMARSGVTLAQVEPSDQGPGGNVVVSYTGPTS